MKDLFLYVNKEEEIGNMTRVTSVLRKIPVTKITCSKCGHSNYRALIHDHKKHAPYNREWPIGEVWVRFQKNENKHIKFPVLEDMEVVDI